MTPPVTTIPARPSAWEPLEAALRQRRPLRLTYHGRQRLMSPHALGWNHGRPMLLAYQTPTPAAPTAHADSPPGWRCMYIDEIDGIHSADPASAWATADSYNPTRPFPAIDHVTIAI
jgi:hypothetical protein